MGMVYKIDGDIVVVCENCGLLFKFCLVREHYFDECFDCPVCKAHTSIDPREL